MSAFNCTCFITQETWGRYRYDWKAVKIYKFYTKIKRLLGKNTKHKKKKNEGNKQLYGPYKKGIIDRLTWTS